MESLTAIASWIYGFITPIRSLGSLIRSYDLPDLVDNTRRPPNSLTRVKPAHIYRWKEKTNGYTFSRCENQLAVLEKDLRASLPLHRPVSFLYFDRFQPPPVYNRFGHVVSEVRDENQVKKSFEKVVGVRCSLSTKPSLWHELTADQLVEWIIEQWGSADDQGTFDFEARDGALDGILDGLWRYSLPGMLPEDLLGPGAENKVRGALAGESRGGLEKADCHRCSRVHDTLV